MTPVLLYSARRRSFLERLFSRRPWQRFAVETVVTHVDLTRVPVGARSPGPNPSMLAMLREWRRFYGNP